MNKSDREKVFNKCGGRCAYCGCELQKGWHLDHKIPVGRVQKQVAGFYRHKVTHDKIEMKDLPNSWYKDYEYINPKMVFDRMSFPEHDTIENSMPCCQSCNLYKSSLDIETFRKQVGLLVGRLNASFTQYKIAKRFGLVIEDMKPIVFYFERPECVSAETDDEMRVRIFRDAFKLGNFAEQQKAIEFAEWIKDNRWRRGLHHGNWERTFAYKKPETKTSEELFNEFKKLNAEASQNDNRSQPELPTTDKAWCSEKINR